MATATCFTRPEIPLDRAKVQHTNVPPYRAQTVRATGAVRQGARHWDAAVAALRSRRPRTPTPRAPRRGNRSRPSAPLMKRR
jgi:hypothetical protein